MTRKRTFKKRGIPEALSFKRIKDFVNDHDQVNPTFTSSISRWKQPNNSLYFPYTKRRNEILDIVGPTLEASFERKMCLPYGWFDHLSEINGEDPMANDVLILLSKVTDDNWHRGELSKKDLSKFRRTHLKRGSDIGKSPSMKKFITQINDYLMDRGTPLGCLSNLLSLFPDRNIRKQDTKLIYMSCEPWDIVRLGSGKRDVSSCLCISQKAGSQCYSVPEYLADPNMFVCYVEEPSQHKNVKGIFARIIVRIAMSSEGLVMFPDRVYGSVEYQPSMITAIREQAVKLGIKMAWFDTYNISQKSSSIKANMRPTETMSAYGRPIKFTSAEPYFDQQGSARYINPSSGETWRIPVYKLKVETEISPDTVV